MVNNCTDPPGCKTYVDVESILLPPETLIVTGLDPVFFIKMKEPAAGYELGEGIIILLTCVVDVQLYNKPALIALIVYVPLLNPSEVDLISNSL